MIDQLHYERLRFTYISSFLKDNQQVQEFYLLEVSGIIRGVFY